MRKLKLHSLKRRLRRHIKIPDAQWDLSTLEKSIELLNVINVAIDDYDAINTAIDDYDCQDLWRMQYKCLCQYFNISAHLKNLGQAAELGYRRPHLSKVSLPPGSLLMRLFRFFCSKKSMERVYEPLYADFQTESFDLLATGRTWQARWIRIRYMFTLAKTIGLFSFVKLAKRAYELWKVSS